MDGDDTCHATQQSYGPDEAQRGSDLRVACRGDGCEVVSARMPCQLAQAVAVLKLQAAILSLPPLHDCAFFCRAGLRVQLQSCHRCLFVFLVTHTCRNTIGLSLSLSICMNAFRIMHRQLCTAGFGDDCHTRECNVTCAMLCATSQQASSRRSST